MLTKKIFIISWLSSFALSLLSGSYIRTITEYISIGTNQMENIYQVRGWPFYFMVTRVNGTWSMRQNSFLINALIWWLGIMSIVVIFQFIQKRKLLK